MKTSVLPAGARLVGEIEGRGDLIVSGLMEGPVSLDGALLIEEGGEVRGDVQATTLVVRGVLLGTASAKESVRVEVSGTVVGDARAPRVNIVEGARFRGRIQMTGEVAPSPGPRRRRTRRLTDEVGPAEAALPRAEPSLAERQPVGAAAGSSAPRAGAPGAEAARPPRREEAPRQSRREEAPRAPRREEAPRQSRREEAPRAPRREEAPRQSRQEEAPREGRLEPPRRERRGEGQQGTEEVPVTVSAPRAEGPRDRAPTETVAAAVVPTGERRGPPPPRIPGVPRQKVRRKDRASDAL